MFTPSPAVRERGPGGEGRPAPLIAVGGRAKDLLFGTTPSRIREPSVYKTREGVGQACTLLCKPSLQMNL